MPTTSPSTASSMVPEGMLGSSFFSSSAARSVPPVLMPRRNKSPMPKPLMAPPATAARRGLLV